MGYNAIQPLAKRLFSDMNMKYVKNNKHIGTQNLTNFQGTHVAQRKRTLQGP